MKKAFLSLSIILFLQAMLFSSSIFTDDVPVKIKDVIQSAIEENNRGRDDIEFEISNYNYFVDHRDKIHLSFSLGFLDKKLELSIVSDSDKALEKDIRKEISNALYYESSLYVSGDERLDYIYKNSFSFYPKNQYRKGTTLSAYDVKGKRQGVFEIKHTYTDIDELQPIYLSNIKPGLELRKSSAWHYTIYGATNFYASNLALGLEVGNTSLIYPIVPTLSLFYENKLGSYSIYGGVGIEAYCDLNDFLHSSFTFIQEGRLGASASLLVGISDESWEYNGMYSIYYEHRLFPSFYWRVGYSKLPKLGRSLIFGIGGCF